jgi:hypothetical protein
MSEALKSYPSRIDWFFKGIMGSVLCVDLVGAISIYITSGGKLSEVLPFVGVIGMTAALLVGLIYTTRYEIRENELYCRSLIFWKKLPFEAIVKIKKDENFFIGLKLGLALKGLVIESKVGDVYISPEDTEDFIQDLLEKNPSIEVR